jgi:hypothetical protein
MDMYESDKTQLPYKKAIIEQIDRRLKANGPHVAKEHEDRARQFMPFAALTGYAAMTKEQEELLLKNEGVQYEKFEDDILLDLSEWKDRGEQQDV